MDLMQHALRAGRSAPPPQAPSPGATIVAGGGGALGSAVLEALLAGRSFAPVHVIVTQEFHATVQGLHTLLVPAFKDDPGDTPAAMTGIVVFDRERRANGREAAFARPQPAQLPAIARWLQRRGVRHLVVVRPHDAASLPQALKAGLANLDEQAVAALGFEHVVFMRSAQAPAAATSRGLQRVADLVLAQLRLMTPQPDQPVRARKVAQLVAALARRLPGATAGTRVMAPEWIWHAAQTGDLDALALDWLEGRELPPARPTRMRM